MYISIGDRWIHAAQGYSNSCKAQVDQTKNVPFPSKYRSKHKQKLPTFEIPIPFMIIHFNEWIETPWMHSVNIRTMLKKLMIYVLQKYMVEKLEWPEAYALEKILPLVTLYDMISIRDKGHREEKKYLQPHRQGLSV